MPRVFVAAACLLVGSSAAWAGAGDDFCQTLRQGYQDCFTEAMQPDANGQPKGDCPNAKNQMAMLAPKLSANAISEVRTQIQLSYDQWLPLANAVARSGGMSAKAQADLKRQNTDKINSECYKLQMLDY